MLDLKVYDIVRIKRNGGSVYLESVNLTHPTMYQAETDHFDINYSILEIKSCFDEEDNEYTITNVWRLDKNENYMLVWENEKAIEDNKPNHCDCRPSDIKWEEHQKVLVENAELKDIIVELNKEINAMKKGYTK